MAKAVINLQKESGGIVKISPVDGTGITEVTVPESGNLVSVDTAVTDNAIARYDGTTGKLQDSGVVIDDSGNVGIGVVPSASGSSTKGIQTKYNYMGSQGGSGQIMYNAVPTSDTGSKYVYSSLVAVAYEQNASGQHLWKTAPSGTSGSAVSWSTAMTLNSNGNLLVGTTTDNGVDKLQVNGSITSKSSAYKYNDLNNACTVDENTIVANTCLNIPYNDYGYVTIQIATPYSFCMQTFIGLNTPVKMFVRVMAGGNWSAWVEK